MINGLSLALAAASIMGSVGCLRHPRSARLPTSHNETEIDALSWRAAPVFELIGRTVRGLVHREPDPGADGEIGRTIVVGAAVAFVQPLLAIAIVIALRVKSVLGRRRRANEREAEINNGLAEVIDLFAIALLTGTTVGAATQQVGRWAGGEFGQAFTWCERQVARGRTLADALELLPDRLGPQVRPLTAALVATERYGAPIAQSLMQLGADSRADRRRRAEAAARRLPVALLFPLVVCVLPAFLLLTIVPVVADTVSRFDLIGSL